MCFNTSIPVHQYTSIPVAAVTHATHGIDVSSCLISSPLAAVGIEKTSPYSGEFIPGYTVGNSLESSCSHVDHFCPSRPGVIPGLWDHPLPVSGIIPGPQDLLCRLLGNWWIQLHPVGNSLESCRKTLGLPLDHSPDIIPGLEDHLPEFYLDSCRLQSPCLVKPGL